MGLQLYNPFGNTGSHNSGTAPAPAPVGSGQATATGNGGTQSVPAQQGVIPFYKAAKDHIESGNTYSGVAFGGKFNAPIPANGWLSSSVLEVQASGGVNGTNNVAAQADAPWSAISSILVTNANGLQLLSLSGYSAYLAQRYSGMSLFAIESDTSSFTAVSTGASGTGNFHFYLPLWNEYGQYGHGLLPNTNQAATYKVAVVFGASSDVYSTAPGTLPTLSGSIILRSKMAPSPLDIYNRPQASRPPIAGSYQVWSSQAGYTVASGTNNFYSQRVGNVIRLLILVFRSSAGSRATAVSEGTFPSAIKLIWDTTVIFDTTPDLLALRAYALTGLSTPTGCIVIPFTQDENGLAQGEDGSGYIPTLASTKLQFQFVSSHSGGSMELITCDIVSPDGGLAVTA